MDSETKTTPHNDSAKKPYQTPELVVMGDAAEMTQNDFGIVADGSFSPTPAGS